MSAVLSAALPHGRAAIAPEQDEARAEERKLVDRARGGDVAAFEELYRRNVRRIYGLCYRLAGNPTLAEELTQDTFVRAWEKLGGFRGDSAFSSWLYPMAVNLSHSERRSRTRRTARVMPTDDLTPFDKGTAPRAPEAAVDLERALAELPDGARRVFVLHEVHGYKHEEIAEMTGIASGTSKAQLHRARRLLRGHLAR